jgi:hypothetical protein
LRHVRPPVIGYFRATVTGHRTPRSAGVHPPYGLSLLLLERC